MNRYVYSKFKIGFPPLRDWRVTNYMASPVYMGVLLMILLALGAIAHTQMPIAMYIVLFGLFLYGKAWGYIHRGDVIERFVVNGQLFKNVTVVTAKELARHESVIDADLYQYFRRHRDYLMKKYGSRWLDTLSPEEYESYRCGEFGKHEIRYRIFTYWLDYVKYGIEERDE